MASYYKNITTTGTSDLIGRSSTGVQTSIGNFGSGTRSGNPGAISKILITNADNQVANNVSVFLEDAAASTSTNAGNNKYYLLGEGTYIPVGVTLVLEDNVSFDASVYALRIKTNDADDAGAGNLSIIIK
tara:strand:+ start:246 stop:635 length:390 start_codon:yes stop_codon:yes gene_type:complete